jgi:NADH-quinone oxidoreductase subunit L
MGGLRRKLPWTHRTMLVGCIAIAGVPPLAGFFSKDEILWSAYRIGGYGTYVWGMGFAVAAMTAFYMFRLYHMTFSGTFRGTEEQAHHLHESPRTMVVPLQVLAVGSVLAGFLGVPHILGAGVFPNAFERFTEPVFEAAHQALPQVFTAAVPPHGIEVGLMAASVVVALLGIGLATFLFQRHPEMPERMATSLAPVHRVLLGKYYVDELYGALFVRGLALGGGRALYAVDRYVVDGGDGEVRPGLGVNGVAWSVRDVIAGGSNLFDRWVVDGLVNLTALVLDNLSYVFRALQNGLVQHYALSMIIAFLFMVYFGSKLIL